MKLYTAEELSKILKVHKNSIYKWGKEGELETVRVGKSTRFVMPKIEGSRARINEQQ